MACAALLLEVAEADYEENPAEIDAVLHALKTELNLDQATVRALLDRARQEPGPPNADSSPGTPLWAYDHLVPRPGGSRSAMRQWFTTLF